MGRKGEREASVGDRYIISHTPLLGTWPVPQACALTGNQTGDPLVCGPALNPLSHSSWASYQICLAISF